MNQKDEDQGKIRSDVFIFIYLPVLQGDLLLAPPPEFTIVSSRTVAAQIHADHETWQNTPGLKGQGALQSVKQSKGRFAHWRKIWSRIVDVQEALQPVRIATLEAITNTIETCKQVGLTDAEIQDKVSEFLVARNRTKSA